MQDFLRKNYKYLHLGLQLFLKPAILELFSEADLVGSKEHLFNAAKNVKYRSEYFILLHQTYLV